MELEEKFKEILYSFFEYTHNEECSKEIVKIAEDYAIGLLQWLTSKESDYSIIYGGTPELDNDYRFAGMQEDYTIEEILQLYNKHLKTNESYKDKMIRLVDKAKETNTKRK